MNPVGRGMQNENHRMKVDSFCDFHFHSENENEDTGGFPFHGKVIFILRMEMNIHRMEMNLTGKMKMTEWK